MERITHFYRGSHIPAATLNRMQSEGINLLPASANPAVVGSDEARALKGADGRYICTPTAGVSDGILRVLDDTLDWSGRVVEGVFIRLTAAAQRLHGADAWQGNDPTQGIAVRRFANGRLGTGALGAASATVASGTPPMIASGSFAVIIDELESSADRVYLFARPSDGALCLYNDSGTTLHAELFIRAYNEAQPLGAGPSPVPTLTDLLYLGQGLAAALPTVDPEYAAETRGIYYATDEARPYYWDGSVWGAWGGASSAPAPTSFIAVCLYATTDLSSATACGRCRVDPADLARSGLTTALTLEVIGDVSTVGPSGSVELYDLTAAASVATITFTETTPTRKTASVVLPGAAHLYELRVSLSGGSGPGDYLTIGGAQLRVTWS